VRGGVVSVGTQAGGPSSELERRVVETVRAMRGELVSLTSALVALDTTARDAGEPPREEAELQRLLAARLDALGAEIDLWEPRPTGAGGQFVPPDLDFVGRPQLVARLAGGAGRSVGAAGHAIAPGAAGRGADDSGHAAGVAPRSLLLTGHIDAVDVEPREQWTSDPFVATERDGFLFGRGTNDMKGGLATLIVALEALHAAGVTLAGEIVFAAVTDEESSGMGSWSVVERFRERGLHPDAGLCAEPTEFEAWVACRGILKPLLTIPGRAGHSQEPQPGWREGGAVNAIDKLVPILTEVRRLNEDWRGRSDQRHPFLSAGDIVPVLVDGGTWDVTYPAFCHLTLDCHYLPAHWHESLGAEPVKAEIRERIDAAAAADPWLAEHPIAWQWEWEVPPAEIAAGHPLVTTVLDTAAAFGHPSHPGGLDSWHDAATFTLHGGVPTFSYGPCGMSTAHAVNERVSINELVDTAAIVAVAAMRWCGMSAGS
jgi:acetylornithine deacetylase